MAMDRDIFLIYPAAMAMGYIYPIVMATDCLFNYALVLTFKHSTLYSIYGQCLGSHLVSTIYHYTNVFIT